MKQQRHAAIRELLVKTAVTSQDELRRKLAGRGFHVTQATLSRDIHELRLNKGPTGYSPSRRQRLRRRRPPGNSRSPRKLRPRGPSGNQSSRSSHNHRKRPTHRCRHRLRGLARSRRNHRRRRHGPHHLPGRKTSKSLEDTNRRLSWLTP